MPEPTQIIRVLSHSFIVTYADTDQMGVVYHSNYLKWFEIGRTDLLRALGHDYRNWERTHGVFLPVVSATMEFRKPARYDDWVAVETRLCSISAVSVDFQYEVLRVSHQFGWTQDQRPSQSALLATGTTRHAFVGRDGRIRRVAADLLPELFPGKV